MSEVEVNGPYIYQPYGPASHPNRRNSGRFYGIGGVPGADIKGLTKQEANLILQIFKEIEIGVYGKEEDQEATPRR